ncbi:hypothetical protein WICPIJ_005051 [Wickerhamomyces pijperi]|uniref:PCI domain-containing protein n=1 Tax=Wickerhamomyces pijperi TaxID=599730 RepID=A0A9P8TMQ1_WICPI|nr:hypothetical protein WICPIJ_005051 [Wickerhamomyces pijperi]
MRVEEYKVSKAPKGLKESWPSKPINHLIRPFAMSAQSYLNVDGSLSESVNELATVLDHFNPELNYAEKLNAFAVESAQQDDDEDLEYSEELFTEISNSAKYFVAVPERETESLVNLVISILNYSQNFLQLTSAFFSDLIQQTSSAAQLNSKKRTSKLISTISNLTTVFNFVSSAEYQFKNSILSKILEIVQFLETPAILKPIFATEISQLVSFDEADEQSVKATRAILSQLSELTFSFDEKKSIEYLQYSILNLPSPTPELVESFLIKNFNAKSVVDLSYISKLQITLPTQYATLLNDYLTSPAAEFSAKSQTASFPLINFETVIAKNQTITFLNKAHTVKSLSFQEISELLAIPQEQVEIFLVNVIKGQFVQGKIDQINQLFKIYKVCLIVKPVELQDWLDIKAGLLKWKSNLKDIKALIDQAQKKKKTANN